MLNVRHLEIFRAVVRAGSVSAAARMLYVSQPAVTKTLRLLEAELGLTLFQRVKGRLVCTPEADALMPEVERLFSNVESVRQVALEIRQGVRGRIAVASVPTLSMSVVARAIEVFHQQYPQVLFDVRGLSTHEVVKYVESLQVDLGLLDVPTSVTSLDVADICKSALVCVLHRDHPLARHTTLTPDLLAGHPIITFADDTYTGLRLREAFRECGVAYQAILVSDNTGTLCATVEAMNAVALVNAFIPMLPAFPGLVMRRFSPRIDMQSCFLFSPIRPHSAIVTQFTDAIRGIFAQRCDVLPARRR